MRASIRSFIRSLMQMGLRYKVGKKGGENMKYTVQEVVTPMSEGNRMLDHCEGVCPSGNMRYALVRGATGDRAVKSL